MASVRDQQSAGCPRTERQGRCPPGVNDLAAFVGEGGTGTEPLVTVSYGGSGTMGAGIPDPASRRGAAPYQAPLVSMRPRTSGALVRSWSILEGSFPPASAK